MDIKRNSYNRHRFNLNFIKLTFGMNIILLLKQWIEINYRLIEAYSKFEFLRIL